MTTLTFGEFSSTSRRLRTFQIEDIALPVTNEHYEVLGHRARFHPDPNAGFLQVDIETLMRSEGQHNIRTIRSLFLPGIEKDTTLRMLSVTPFDRQLWAPDLADLATTAAYIAEEVAEDDEDEDEEDDEDDEDVDESSTEDQGPPRVPLPPRGAKRRATEQLAPAISKRPRQGHEVPPKHRAPAGERCSWLDNDGTRCKATATCGHGMNRSSIAPGWHCVAHCCPRCDEHRKVHNGKTYCNHCR
jgi:hypothetical protein